MLQFAELADFRRNSAMNAIAIEIQEFQALHLANFCWNSPLDLIFAKGKVREPLELPDFRWDCSSDAVGVQVKVLEVLELSDRCRDGALDILHSQPDMDNIPLGGALDSVPCAVPERDRQVLWRRPCVRSPSLEQLNHDPFFALKVSRLIRPRISRC